MTDKAHASYPLVAPTSGDTVLGLQNGLTKRFAVGSLAAGVALADAGGAGLVGFDASETYAAGTVGEAVKLKADAADAALTGTTTAEALEVGAAGTAHVASDFEYRSTANLKRALFNKTITGVPASGSENHDTLHVRLNQDGAQANSYTYTGSALHARLSVGENAAASGTSHALSANVQLYDINNAGGGISEFTPLFGCLNARNANSNAGINLWALDLNSYGPSAGQEGFIGAAVMAAKYHSGVTDDATHRGAFGHYVATRPQGGGGKDDGFTGLTSYPMHAALRVVGWSGPQTATSGVHADATTGWNYGLHVGGATVTGPWVGATSRSKIGTGVRIEDHVTYGIQIINRHSANTGHALHIDPTAGNVGIHTTPDASQQVAIGAAGSSIKAFLSEKAFTLGSAATTETVSVQLGDGRTGDGECLVDFVGDATYTDYGLRLRRASGANGASVFSHRGTSEFKLACQDSGDIWLSTAGVVRFGATTASVATPSTHKVAIKLEDGSTFYLLGTT